MNTRLLRSLLSAGVLTAALSFSVLPSLAQDTTAEPTAEATAEPTLIVVTDEATPETTAEPTVEVTAEATTETVPTAAATSAPGVTPTATTAGTGSGGAATSVYAVTEPELQPFSADLLSRLQLPAGFQVSIYAQGLENPRIMVFGDDGTLYISQRTAGNVLALNDADGDGVAEQVRTVAEIELAHGLTINNGQLYIAANRSIYTAAINADGSLAEPQLMVDDLPESGQHSARTLAFGADGMIYLNIGSPCNACGNSTQEYATILQIQPDFSSRSVYASGLRHTIGFGWHPMTGQMWGFDHGTDTLGDDVPPEELNLLEQGNNYGWPYCYGDKIVNEFIPGQPPGSTKEDFCAASVAPVLSYQAHSAPIGMVFYTANQFPTDYLNDAFVAMRGSWNRSQATGYKIIRVLFDDNGQPTGFEDFMTGFLSDDGLSQFGRPAGLVVAPDGSLLLAEDTNGIIYRITYTGS
jgi:glucose/arabinose dehydrogenase